MVNVGIDLHKTQFTICLRAGGREEFEVYPTTAKGYEAFIKAAARWEQAGQKVRVAVESTGNTRYFKGQMEEAGIEVKVINTLKMKVVNESVKKTDKHDAATIAEFLEKDMLPESVLCGKASEQMRRLLKARKTLVEAQVVMKNQIHALLSAEGMEDVKGSLQSKKGRKRVLESLKHSAERVVVQPLFETIERLEEGVKSLEEELRVFAEGDRMVELLRSIPGCGEICAWTIRAWTDSIMRFASAKKYCSYAGLVPWVQNSNQTIHHGKITKRGPQELRTALVQVVMGVRRMLKTTHMWRLMQRHEAMKKTKGSGKAIVATARKLAVIIWHMLSEDVEFDLGKMVQGEAAKRAEGKSEPVAPDKNVRIEKQEEPAVTMPEDKGAKRAEGRSEPVVLDKGVWVERQEGPGATMLENKGEKNTGVARERRKKIG
jgi:transposase